MLNMWIKSNFFYNFKIEYIKKNLFQCLFIFFDYYMTYIMWHLKNIATVGWQRIFYFWKHKSEDKHTFHIKIVCIIIVSAWKFKFIKICVLISNFFLCFCKFRHFYFLFFCNNKFNFLDSFRFIIATIDLFHF